MPKVPKTLQQHEALAEKVIDESAQRLRDAGMTEFSVGIALGQASGRLQRAAFPEMGHFTEDDLALMVASNRDADGIATSWTPAVRATVQQIDDEIVELEDYLEDIQEDIDALRAMRKAKAPAATN